MRESGEPETFAGIHPGPLDKAEPFLKLKSFIVSRPKRRDGQLAPCPMCHKPNKFLEGDLVYLTRLQAIAAIGHECSARETRTEAEREYRARAVRDQEDNYLLDQLPLIQFRLAQAEPWKPYAQSAQRTYRMFRTKAPAAHRYLRAVKEQGGRLVVAEAVSREVTAVGPRGFRGSSGVDTRDIRLRHSGRHNGGACRLRSGARAEPGHRPPSAAQLRGP